MNKHVIRMASTLCLALILLSCSQREQLGSKLEMQESLPGVQQLPAPVRHVSDVSRYTFGELDLLANSQSTYFEQGELWLAGPEEVSYAVLGATLDTGTPVRVDLFGIYNGNALSVAVADFDSNSWEWLAVGLTSGALLDVPETALGPNNEFALALVTSRQDEFDWDVIKLVSVVVDDDAAGDEAAPVWDNEEGVTSADGSFPLLAVYHGEATDPGTAPTPVAYVVYAAPDFAGIDWTRPLDIFVDDDSAYLLPEYGTNSTLIEVAVRAMDARGNLTSNENSFAFYLPYETGEPEDPMPGAVWRAGDKVVLRWDNPADNFGFAVLGSHPYMEGDAEFPEPDDMFVTSPENTEAGAAEEWVAILPGAPEGAYTIEVRGDSAGEAVLEVQHADGAVTHVMDVTIADGWAGDVAYLYFRSSP